MSVWSSKPFAFIENYRGYVLTIVNRSECECCALGTLHKGQQEIRKFTINVMSIAGILNKWRSGVDALEIGV